MTKAAKQAIGQRILTRFRDSGASEIAPDILLPADTLLDLYGEEIRARAYVTTDPQRGEVMLRPDFTVPVVQRHMRDGAEPARYCYLGEVFRKQDSGENAPDRLRDNEYLQVGYELFSRDPSADAEVFSTFYQSLAPYSLKATMGDMAIATDALAALPLSQHRREALIHHIWRPARFARLLARYTQDTPAADFPKNDAPWIGLRSGPEMEARIARRADEAQQEPLAPEWQDRLTRLFQLRAPAPAALAVLTSLAEEMPAISQAVTRLDQRLKLLAGQGVDIDSICFDASHGRATMEYYDGMTFSFTGPDPSWPPVASGGRYDALTRALGGSTIPAVGGIIRPGLIAELEGA